MAGLYPGFFPGSTAYPGSGDSTPRITATPDPDNSPPRVLLQILNAGTATTGQIIRYGTDSQPIPVRQGDPATLSSGTWIGYDYEIRYNQPARYEFAPANGSARLTSGTAQLDVGQCWLIHPGVPDLSCPVTVKLVEDETLRSSGGLYDVLDSEYPIPRSGSRRKAPAFDLVLKTTTRAQREALFQLFLEEVPMLLQMVHPQFTDESEYLWVWVGDIGRARRAQLAQDGARYWTLPCAEVARPLGGIQSQRTWADLMLECATWADVLAKYKTWRGVLTGIPGT